MSHALYHLFTGIQCRHCVMRYMKNERKLSPVDTQHHNDVLLTSMRGNAVDAASTSFRHHVPVRGVSRNCGILLIIFDAIFVDILLIY